MLRSAPSNSDHLVYSCCAHLCRTVYENTRTAPHEATATSPRSVALSSQSIPYAFRTLGAHGSYIPIAAQLRTKYYHDTTPTQHHTASCNTRRVRMQTQLLRACANPETTFLDSHHFHENCIFRENLKFSGHPTTTISMHPYIYILLPTTQGYRCPIFRTFALENRT